MALLNQQRISEVGAYRRKRWPGQKLLKGEPIVTGIRYAVEEAAVGGAKAAPVPVPASELNDEADHAM